MSGRSYRRLNNGTKRLLKGLVVVPLQVIGYTFYDDHAEMLSGWHAIYYDGANIYEEPKIVPFTKTLGPFLLHKFLSALGAYLKEKHGRNMVIHDYMVLHDYKPRLNLGHPWYKELVNGKR